MVADLPTPGSIAGVWLYQQIEPEVFEVGYYDPRGAWHMETQQASRAEAAARVAYLNGL